jgi:predicted histidine transporter YuiF (NhaC family)
METILSKIISNFLLITGMILIGMSIYYIFRIIHFNLWDDVIFRVVSVMSFIGGGLFIGLSRILKNQSEIIQLLRKTKSDVE